MTMQLQIIPFKARHLTDILPEADADMRALAERAEGYGNAFTALVAGEPVGAAGIAVTDPYRAEVWTLLSAELKTRYPKSLYKHCKQLMDHVEAEAKLKKITAAIDPRDATAIRFITRLGFQRDTSDEIRDTSYDLYIREAADERRVL